MPSGTTEGSDEIQANDIGLILLNSPSTMKPIKLLPGALHAALLLLLWGGAVPGAQAGSLRRSAVVCAGLRRRQTAAEGGSVGASRGGGATERWHVVRTREQRGVHPLPGSTCQCARGLAPAMAPVFTTNQPPAPPPTPELQPTWQTHPLPAPRGTSLWAGGHSTPLRRALTC